MSNEERPTFTAVTGLVRIHLRGVPHKKGFPYIPNDQGIVSQLLQAQCNNELPLSFRTESCGGGSYVALFYEEDAAKVIEWLEQRCDKVKEHP